MAFSDAFAGDFNLSTTTTATTGASQWFLDGANGNTTAFGTAANATANDLQTDTFQNPLTFTTAGTASTDFRWRIDSNDTFNITAGNLDFSAGLLGLKHALMQIFKKVPKDLVLSEADKILVRAKEKSEKLLKSWLSPKEYEGLTKAGQLEIPSVLDKDVIFIIKRDPNEMVDVKVKGEFSHRLCAVSKNLEMPVGDQLLSKLLLLKTDERRFKEIAIKH